MIGTNILYTSPVPGGWWFVRFTADFGFTADHSLWPLVTSGLCIGPNWYGLSAG